MPQMEFADYAPQIVWLAITFTALYFLMARLALPRIEQVLTAREGRIQGDLAQAAQFGQQAEAAARAFERVVADTRARAQKVAAEARERASAEQAARLGKLEAELHDRIRRAEADIAGARGRAMESLRDVAADIAQAAAEKLTGERVTREAAAQAVDAELKTRG